MPVNKTEALYKLFPKAFQARYNQNWKAIIDSVGQQDQIVADLIEEVRRQLFVNTATRPYLDRLAANVKAQRPRFIGMEDSSFREYIPVMSYAPKQVKLIMDKLLDLFYFKESTTAYAQTTLESPFHLEDGWELLYSLDEFSEELIVFKTNDFSDISNATAAEVASAINRQVKNGFAIAYEDGAVKKTYIRIFTNTIGAKGSVRVLGGRANIGLRFDGFLNYAGTGSTASWSVQRTGDTATMKFISGDAPGLEHIQEGDVAILDLSPAVPGNKLYGSFPITEVNVSENYFKFKSNSAPNALTLFSQTDERQVKFFTPIKQTLYRRSRRAATWELSPGEVDIEIPASPPVVKRKLAGSAHINGLTASVKNRISDTSLEIDRPDQWPSSGEFVLKQMFEIVSKNDSDSTVVSSKYTERFDPKGTVYTYTGKAGAVLTGISPELPIASGMGEVDVASGSRTSNVYDIYTVQANTYRVGDKIVLTGITASSGLTENKTGAFEVIEVISPTQFKCYSEGDDGVINGSLGGKVRVERAGMANAGSQLMFKPSRTQTRIYGPYLWDSEASFVQSYIQTPLPTKISAGNQVKIINTGINNFPENGGYLIFGFGTSHQEGPVRYFFKTPDGSMYVDPSYTFNKTHSIGTTISLINKFGAHSVSTTGVEYSGYNTDTSVGRKILQELISQVKSAGLFVNFIIRFPSQLYSSFDVYDSGIDPDVPVYNLQRGITS